MIVLKFGGTSVGSATMMDRTLDIVNSVIEQGPILVSSAITKVTDSLVSINQACRAGKSDEAFALVTHLRTLHTSVAEELLSGAHLEAGLAALEALFSEMSSIVRGLTLIREVSPRSQDAILSFGERLSTCILYYRAREKGIDAQLLDARQFIKTDEHFTSANLRKNLTHNACKDLVKPAKGRMLITQGFIGSTEKGLTTTLGRGGSDYSATIIGAALGAEQVQIWTDVDGIMTTDPRIIPHAQVLPEISYNEAAELSYFGAKVIHPSTIQPAVELGIPVWVKNTKNPAAVGTAITPHGAPAAQGVQAIAGKKNIAVITVKSTRMLNAYGFMRRIFEVFDAHKVSVDLVATSEVSVSVTVDDASHVQAVRNDLETFADVVIEDKKAIICLVGRDLWKDTNLLSRVFTALSGLNIRLITMGASDINLSFVLPQEQLETAIRKLHDSLFTKPQ